MHVCSLARAHMYVCMFKGMYGKVWYVCMHVCMKVCRGRYGMACMYVFNEAQEF